MSGPKIRTTIGYMFLVNAPAFSSGHLSTLRAACTTAPTARLHAAAARVHIMGFGLPLAGFNFFTGEGEYPNQTTQTQPNVQSPPPTSFYC
jgi:hypothetical protein